MWVILCSTNLELPFQWPGPSLQSILCCRTPEYNGVRFFFAVCIGLLFGAIFWKLGDDNSTQLGLFNVLGGCMLACHNSVCAGTTQF